jgi:hypothetical protein
MNSLFSPLLRLPAELRNNIYTHALSGHDIEVISDFSAWRYTLYPYRGVARTPLSNLLSLSRTCVQLYSGTSLLASTLNSFFVQVEDMQWFV